MHRFPIRIVGRPINVKDYIISNSLSIATSRKPLRLARPRAACGEGEFLVF